MEELTVLAEMEHTKLLKAIPTAFEAGIWRYCLYAIGVILSFMDDTFTREQINVSNIIINQIEYTEVDTLEELRTTLSADDGGWVNGGSVVYVKFPYYYPPFLFYSHRYGTFIGFTDNNPVLIDGRMYRPGMFNVPIIEQSADAFTYDKMKFNSASVSIENTNGQFDDIADLFGNEFNLHVRAIDEEQKRKLAQYYIANITVSLNKATFHLKDKRERLSAKIPDKKFTKEKYPFIDDNLIDKDMQEVYGRCFGIPGVCLQGKQIYAKPDEPQESAGYLTQYRFRFSSAITRVDRIQVKMTSGKLPVNENDPMGPQKDVDGWTEVYNIETGWKPRINPIGDVTSLLANGEITLPWQVARQEGDREKGINEVRMDGLFINKSTPLEIIKDVMYRYSNFPFDERRYDTVEITDELAPLDHEIGIMFDKPISVYEAIEQLQSGCVLGFQFRVYENKFTARLDDPNRDELPAIKSHEIQNLDEVEIDWNAELYGTYTDIEYAYNYGEKSGRHWIDKTMQRSILEIHRINKEWPAHSLLANIQDAELKSSLLLEDFKDRHPLIKNIKLYGEKWFDLRVYDIFYIDIYIPGEEKDKYPHKLIMLIDRVGRERVVIAQKNEIDEYVTMINEEKANLNERKFAGRVRCQVLRVELDIQTGITTIDVREKKESEIWPK